MLLCLSDIIVLILIINSNMLYIYIMVQSEGAGLHGRKPGGVGGTKPPKSPKPEPPQPVTAPNRTLEEIVLVRPYAYITYA